MEASSKYWKICQISQAYERAGYEYRTIPLAQDFFYTQFSTSPNQNSLQKALLSCFHAEVPEITNSQRAHAGLCLRCSVSHPILKACQTLDNLYSGDKQFTYHDLLPFVLTDDGKQLIILDEDGKTHLRLDGSGNLQSTTFKTFTVEVLRTFKPNSPSSMSLDNWAFLQTKQCSEIKDFLAEFGFQHLSDWALLNRVRPKQLEQLEPRDRHLVEAFHAVYRRDRRQHNQAGRCFDPNDSQLAEMLGLLQQQGISLHTHELMKALRQVAKQLRQVDIWQSRVPLEEKNENTGHYELRVDLPSNSSKEMDTEDQEFLELLYHQSNIALTQAIEEAIQALLNRNMIY